VIHYTLMIEVETGRFTVAVFQDVAWAQKGLNALKQAGFFARNIVVPGAGHFWASDPVDEPGSFGAYVGPRLLRFLAASL